ncbi:hypothetical protein PW5551_01765 [Petrotoga sp. 9PW.55.5.1]|uniref:glycerol-3-phosphate 1-O-acyltransferase PlsY n=1 Tax=Petrotoga sp. 9PW.55.5.1 TaxID=1308979 RepID=UPI000DC35F15|nr:glycerol-3-phosphate 1-O-acyltransferase PlsY [Petrotoga sp. 9PW.55.5.1]RAO99781.1 hypothetical protein PW5551_01765 [Petrotoga sp. 9PW.55.5.1]
MIITVLVICYLFGSIPFSFLIPWSKGIDIRKKGSGNVGGTNVLRTLGPKWGALSIALDFLKAFVPVLITRSLFGVDLWVPLLAVLLVVLGHDYSIFLKFKGGKGVASTLGGFFALTPILGLIFLLIWFPIELTTKYVSLASLSGLFFVAIFSYFVDPKIGFIYSILFLMSLFKHRSNVKRLLSKTENKTDIVAMLKRWKEIK